jgi:glycerophosphoryl diester phosphodiesterase
VAPENTLAAFKAAIDAGADYVELDVQHTRDRQVVVMHDADFMRMGGDPRRVADLTAAEIATIDIGRKFGPQFAGQHAPTLEEVIDLARGRIRINIELKYNVPDPGLAPAVVELLRGEDFIDQVVVTSLDYAALKQVKSLEPRIRTGHIVTAAVGDVLRTEADFLSLNSAKAPAPLVRRARAAGKDVAVWTVNDPEVMLRMIERGVDNIITDDPALLVRVMKERGALDKAEILGLRLRVLFDKPPRAVTDPDAVEPL